MPERGLVLVTNTTPLIAITAATGSLDVLNGSVGVLLKAKRLGYDVSIPEALQRMRAQGIWLSEQVVRFALTQC
ncbi:MAG: hypothetical protein A3I66_20295 [Burkholderiales bacterium RIFCSPLOWO2_02_FULL_57_36]|nr:MAG: hypothetical protein A3I66_20295 [Burkholderiales bacterium RIFCSPLOWO2_02_FULL_57_36]